MIGPFKNIPICAYRNDSSICLKLTSTPVEEAKTLSEPEFYTKVSQGQVAQAVVEVDELVYNISGKLADGTSYVATVSKETDIIKLLREKKVDYTTQPVPPPSIWTTLLSTLLPIILLIAS